MIASEERLALEEVKRLEPILGKETGSRAKGR